MSGSSNPSINSPTSTNHKLNTLTREDTQFTTRLLQEFNAQQTHHISVLSTNSSVQYIPHSPTPSVQEGASPPLLCVCIAPNGIGHHPPISPGLAKTILRMEVGNNFHDTARAIAYGLISMVCQQTA